MSKLRDKIAIAALQGMIQFLGWDPEAQFHGKEEKNKDVLTKSAYAYADAMLEERAKTTEFQPQPKPLTPQQISEGNQSMFNVTREAFKQGVIFAEKAHGITGGGE